MKSLHAGFHRLLATAAIAAALTLPSAAIAQEHEFAAQLTELANGALQDVATNPVVIDAIRKQNEETAGYDAARIEQLDSQWRAEVGAASKPLMAPTDRFPELNPQNSETTSGAASIPR